MSKRKSLHRLTTEIENLYKISNIKKWVYLMKRKRYGALDRIEVYKATKEAKRALAKAIKVPNDNI